MSNRFHNKFHKHNHHTRPTDREGLYPDSAYDPIASAEFPFEGEFFVNGDIRSLSSLQIDLHANILKNLTADNSYFKTNSTTVSNVSVGNYLFANDGVVHNNFTVNGNSLTRQHNYILGNNYITNNVFVSGNQSVAGDISIDGKLQIKTVDQYPISNDQKVLVLGPVSSVNYHVPNYRIWDTKAEFLSSNKIPINRIPLYTSLNTLGVSPIAVNTSVCTFEGNVITKTLFFDSSGNSKQWNVSYQILTSLSSDWNMSLDNVNAFNKLLTSIDDRVLTIYNIANANVGSINTLSANYFVIGDSENSNNRAKTSTNLIDLGTFLSAGCSINASNFYGTKNDVNFRAESGPIFQISNAGWYYFKSAANDNLFTLNATEGIFDTNLQVTKNITSNSISTSSLTADFIKTSNVVGINAQTVKAISAITGDITTSSVLNGSVVTATLSNVFTGQGGKVYGSGGRVPFFAVDSKGRTLSAGEVVVTAISSLSGDVSATFNEANGSAIATLCSTGVTPNFYGDIGKIPRFNVDSKGRLISAYNITFNALSSIEGDATMINFVNNGTAIIELSTILPQDQIKTYGTSTFIPNFTVDGKGRITNITEYSISSIALTELVGDVITNSNSRGKVDTQLKTIPTLIFGQYGKEAVQGIYNIPKINIDSKGRIISAVNVRMPAISALEGDVIASFNNKGTLDTVLKTILGPTLVGEYGEDTRLFKIKVNEKGQITDIANQDYVIATQNQLGVQNKQLVPIIRPTNQIDTTSIEIRTNNLLSNQLFVPESGSIKIGENTTTGATLIDKDGICLNKTSALNELGFYEKAKFSSSYTICPIFGNYADIDTSPLGLPQVIYGGVKGSTATRPNSSIEDTTSLKANSMIIRGGDDYPWFTRGNISWQTDNLTRMHLTSAGNLGINTTNPIKTLDVNGDIKCNELVCNKFTIPTLIRIKDLTETYNTILSESKKLNIDLKTGSVFNVTLTTDIDGINIITDYQDSGSKSFTLKIKQPSTPKQIIWNVVNAGPIKWAGGASPVLTNEAGAIDIFTFTRLDNENVWYGGVVGLNFK